MAIVTISAVQILARSDNERLDDIPRLTAPEGRTTKIVRVQNVDTYQPRDSEIACCDVLCVGPHGETEKAKAGNGRTELLQRVTSDGTNSQVR
jgi:hypothetical protein